MLYNDGSKKQQVGLIMSKREKNVKFRLDTGEIKELSFAEVKAILRGADDLINSGGKSLLSKILKGSKDKKLLELGLEKSPVYGFYKDITLEEIKSRIDWLIVKGYLDIQYDYRLPLLIYTEKGWGIEKDTYSNELLDKLQESLDTGDYSLVLDLKDRNREMIVLLLQKIKATKEKRFIPLLEAWSEIEYKKVKIEIQNVIDSLKNQSHLK